MGMADIVPATALATPEPPQAVDYELAYKVLAAALGREMISSEVLYFVAQAVKAGAGIDAARVLVDHMGLNRSRGVHNFMG